ncbi:MAG: carbon monoxide dehydrogenase subunit G [Rhodospirillaceae bacterium]|nr:carbon monoxide dehydrogenase subunit G [Rhodospirillaceae bacterium]
MDMKGESFIALPRLTVWEALNDLDVLKAAIPGCEAINRLSPTEIEATVTAKIGPVKASFKGMVTLSDIDAPNGYTIRGEGKGGAAGFAKGGAKVRLTDAPGGTTLSYDVDASVGGKLAQIGARLIDSTAKKLADDFFQKFGQLAAAKAENALLPDAPQTPNTHQTPMTPAEPSDNVARQPGAPNELKIETPEYNTAVVWIFGVMVLAMIIGLVAVGFLR